MTPRETVIQVMTDTVTVRRDALRALVEVSVAYHGIPLVAPITEVYTRAVDDRLAAMIVSPWQPIETIPTDANKPWDERRFWLLYALEREGLPAMQSVCRYHDDAGWCIDELRTATHWQPLPEPPK